MQEKQDKSTVAYWLQKAQMPLIQGPLIGASVMALVTPGLNWTNHVMNGQRMRWNLRYAMAGALEYSSSAVPSYAIVFFLKKMLQRDTSEKKTVTAYDFATSFFAGASSGLILTPFDVVAVNRHSGNTVLTSTETRQKIRSHHGYAGFLKGALATMSREGVWATIYLTAVPALTQYFLNRGMNKEQSEGLSVILLSGAYGMGSTPVNRLRYLKQVGLADSANETKSYPQLAKGMWNQVPSATIGQRLLTFFKGSLPRTLTVTVATALIVEMKELHDNFTSPSKP